MNKNNNKIQSIKLNINGIDIEISLDAARELYGELDQLFGQPNYIPITVPQPYKKVDDSGWWQNPWCSTTTLGLQGKFLAGQIPFRSKI